MTMCGDSAAEMGKETEEAGGDMYRPVVCLRHVRSSYPSHATYIPWLRPYLLPTPQSPCPTLLGCHSTISPSSSSNVSKRCGNRRNNLDLTEIAYGIPYVSKMFSLAPRWGRRSTSCLKHPFRVSFVLCLCLLSKGWILN